MKESGAWAAIGQTGCLGGLRHVDKKRAGYSRHILLSVWFTTVALAYARLYLVLRHCSVDNRDIAGRNKGLAMVEVDLIPQGCAVILDNRVP